MPSSGSDSLATISQDGKVPETRMSNARQVQDYSRRLVTNDTQRSWKRARVNGLVDGNPPYKASKLREVGRAEACNVNWGIARSYLESSAGAFYDLFSEAPGFISIRCDYGNPDQRDDWSDIISEEADRAIRQGNEQGEVTWDYNMQVSQRDMVLHGYGPFLFEDAHAILPKAFLSGDLKVPEFTKSDTGYWDSCMIQAVYYPPELYKFIKNEKAAKAVGWDVEYTRRVIANAMDIQQQQGVLYDWEFYQQQLKNNALSYIDDTKVCRLAHVLWKEFDGRVTHAIVELNTTVSAAPASLGKKENNDQNTDVQFLYRSIGRYKSFQNAVHPMYFDHGNGGYHHSVTGLGVKMYSAMEYENRLICNLADKAFSPKILFKPTSTEAGQKFSLAHFGDYAVLPGGFEWQLTGVSGLMNEGIAMHEVIQNLLQSNLSSYRQQVPPDKRGNPATKFEKQLEASQQSALNKTQFNRYYEQLDMLYAEIYRRLSNLNTTDERAREFQDRCRKRGVPREAIAKVEKIEATRVVGQGSSFMRKQAIDSLFGIIGALPEDGRDHLIADKIAAEAGQSAVRRYYPRGKQTMPSDQQAEAMQWVAAMKVGVPPTVTSTQNAVIYAQTFLNAAFQAIGSLQQGANPMEVLAFVELAGMASGKQLQRIANDQTRKRAYDPLKKQWEMLGKIADQLKKQIAQMQQQQQAQQQKTQQAMTDDQLKQAKVQSDIQLKQVKTQAQLQQSQQKQQLKIAQGVQDMALNDARTAAEIQRENARLAKELSEPEPEETPA